MQFELGSMVRVVNIDGLTAAELELDEEDFEDFKVKVESGEYAILCDFDDDNKDLVFIVFCDGLEVYGISTSRLMVVDDDLSENFCPRTCK